MKVPFLNSLFNSGMYGPYGVDSMDAKKVPIDEIHADDAPAGLELYFNMHNPIQALQANIDRRIEEISQSKETDFESKG